MGIVRDQHLVTLEDDPQPTTQPIDVRMYKCRGGVSLTFFDPRWPRSYIGEVFVELYNGDLRALTFSLEQLGDDPDVTVLYRPGSHRAEPTT